MEVGGEGDYIIYTYYYTVTTRMMSALRWAAMRAVLMFHNCEGQSHKTVPTDHNFCSERRAEADSNRGLSAYASFAYVCIFCMNVLYCKAFRAFKDLSTLCVSLFFFLMYIFIADNISISMYITCLILCLFSALSRRVGALQISIIVTVNGRCTLCVLYYACSSL